MAFCTISGVIEFTCLTESEYKHMTKIERVNLLNALVSFFKHSEVKTKTFRINKDKRDKSKTLEEELKFSMVDYLESKTSEINKFCSC